LNDGIFLTNLKTKEKITEKRKTTEETESKPSNPKLVKKNYQQEFFSKQKES
jgi:hypothetical protein